MKYRLHTLKITMGEHTVKLTQKLFPEKYVRGHYDWIITDKFGNILTSGSSTGGAPERVDSFDLQDKHRNWLRWQDDDTYE